MRGNEIERSLSHMWVGLWKLWWTERSERKISEFVSPHYSSIAREDVNHNILILFLWLSFCGVRLTNYEDQVNSGYMLCYLFVHFLKLLHNKPCIY